MCLCWLSCCIRLPWRKLSRPMLLPSASILLPYPSSLPARLLLPIPACLACLSVRCSFACLPSSRPGASILIAFLDISQRLSLPSACPLFPLCPCMLSPKWHPWIACPSLFSQLLCVSPHSSRHSLVPHSSRHGSRCPASFLLSLSLSLCLHVCVNVYAHVCDNV